MIILIGFLIAITSIAVWWGMQSSLEIEVGLEIKRMSNAYFNIGISFDVHSLQDGCEEQEIKLGLFFVNLVVIFFKCEGKEN
jgi:hypothetical protein